MGHAEILQQTPGVQLDPPVYPSETRRKAEGKRREEVEGEEGKRVRGREEGRMGEENLCVCKQVGKKLINLSVRIFSFHLTNSFFSFENWKLNVKQSIIFLN